jgi:hypothetical protein
MNIRPARALTNREVKHALRFLCLNESGAIEAIYGGNNKTGLGPSCNYRNKIGE